MRLAAVSSSSRSWRSSASRRPRGPARRGRGRPRARPPPAPAAVRQQQDAAEASPATSTASGRLPVDDADGSRARPPEGRRPASRRPARARAAGTASSSGSSAATGRARESVRPAPPATSACAHQRETAHQRQRRRQPHQPVDAAARRLEAHELAVRALEVGEDLLLVVARGQQLAHARLHVGGHGRPASRPPTAPGRPGSAGARRPPPCGRRERRPESVGAPRRADDVARIFLRGRLRGLEAGLPAGAGSCATAAGDASSAAASAPAGHDCAAARPGQVLRQRFEGVSGPVYLAAIFPCASTKKVSGTP